MCIIDCFLKRDREEKENDNSVEIRARKMRKVTRANFPRCFRMAAGIFFFAAGQR